MKVNRISPLWLGLDLGTQSVRAMAVSASGEVAGLGSHPLTSRRDGPRHEQDPEEWWHAVAHACRAAFQEISTPEIRGLAVDATSGTVLIADAGGRALTPGLMYDDTRATAETQRVNAVGADLWADIGYHRMPPAWGLPKLLWLLQENANAHPPGAQIAHQSDFINRRLAGHPVATDTSNALKSGCDPRDESWPQSVFDALHFPASVLPAIVRPGTQLGEVCTAAAAQTGIPRGTPIFAGMTDGCAAQIGAGALRVGSWNAVLGTTLVLKGVSAELIRDPLGVVYSHRAPHGQWLPGGASSTGSAALGKYFPGRNLDELAAQATARKPSSVIAYPLVGRGERFPFHAPEAEGFLLGEARDEIDHFGAFLRGVAFIERLCFDYLALLGAPTDGDLMLTGGGAKSRPWCQLRADVLQRPVKIPENPEAAFGMAILAAAHERDLAEVAAEMVRIRETIHPRPAHAEREGYLRLVTELETRGWLPTALASHCKHDPAIYHL